MVVEGGSGEVAEETRPLHGSVDPTGDRHLGARHGERGAQVCHGVEPSQQGWEPAPRTRFGTAAGAPGAHVHPRRGRWAPGIRARLGGSPSKESHEHPSRHRHRHAAQRRAPGEPAVPRHPGLRGCRARPDRRAGPRRGDRRGRARRLGQRRVLLPRGRGAVVRQPEPVAAGQPRGDARPLRGRRGHLPGARPGPVERHLRRGRAQGSSSSTRSSAPRRPRRPSGSTGSTAATAGSRASSTRTRTPTTSAGSRA